MNMNQIYLSTVILIISNIFINYFILQHIGPLLLEGFRKNNSEVKDELLIYLFDVYDYWTIYPQTNYFETSQNFINYTN